MIFVKNKIGVDELKNELLLFVNIGVLWNNEIIIMNIRYYDLLLKVLDEI